MLPAGLAPRSGEGPERGVPRVSTLLVTVLGDQRTWALQLRDIDFLSYKLHGKNTIQFPINRYPMMSPVVIKFLDWTSPNLMELESRVLGTKLATLGPKPSEQCHAVEVTTFSQSQPALYTWDCWEYVILRADWKRKRKVGLPVGGCPPCTSEPRFSPSGSDPGPEARRWLSILMMLVRGVSYAVHPPARHLHCTYGTDKVLGEEHPAWASCKWVALPGQLHPQPVPLLDPPASLRQRRAESQ